MAGKFDAEFAKKHHFWLLLAPAALFVMLACIFVISDVAGDTETKDADNKKKFGELDQYKKAARKTIEKLNKQKEEVEKQQKLIWDQAWKEQEYLNKWPEGYSDSKALEEAKKMPFGATDLDKQEFAAIRREFGQEPILLAEYNKIEENLQPMQWAGGMKGVLQPPDWTRVLPNSEDMWLALENLWVQREILGKVAEVNKRAAKFELKPNTTDVYRSKIWEVQLKVERKEGGAAPKGPGFYLTGRIRNISPRLQVFGISNRLKLNVWFNNDDSKAFSFEIEGTTREGDPNPDEDKPEKWLAIKTIDKHLLPVDLKEPRQISRVEQDFDIRTVPIKRVEAFAIGKSALSDRNCNYDPLMMSQFSKKATLAAVDPGKEEKKEEKKGGGGMPNMPSMPGGAGGKKDKEDGEASKTRYGVARERYLSVTDQVRRLPVAFAVVTDQSYLDEIVQAVANTKMRYQTTQMEWTRFHDTLTYGTAPGAAAATGGTGRTQAAPTTNREDQFSANLLVVSMYGIVSLYEKYSEAALDPKNKKDVKVGPKDTKTPSKDKTPDSKGPPGPMTPTKS
jgi:uncharacterized protein YpmS